MNGTTTHGGQFLTPRRRREPVAYYSRSGPAGQVMAAAPRSAKPGRVAVLGLGTGAMACHARPSERWTFYEIDPVVARIARDPLLFSYLRDCPGTHEVELGDARLSLAQAPADGFGVIVGDAFSSDSIPVHLLTREAVALYRSKLAADGVIALHISNRFLDLEPVVGALARDAGLACLARAEPRRASRGVPGKLPSHWTAMAERPAVLARLAADPRWRRCRGGGPRSRPWTDDFSNIVGAADL